MSCAAAKPGSEGFCGQQVIKGNGDTPYRLMSTPLIPAKPLLDCRLAEARLNPAQSVDPRLSSGAPPVQAISNDIPKLLLDLPHQRWLPPPGSATVHEPKRVTGHLKYR
jgi:hypothetical protein